MTLRATFDGAHIKPDDPTALTRYKHTLTPGQVIYMTLEKRGEKRTTSQQGLLHKLIDAYARDHGLDSEFAKRQFKVSAGYYVPASKILDGTIVPGWRGMFIDLADMYESYAPGNIIFLRSESTYDTKMETELIERVILACNESGVDISAILERAGHDRA